MDKNYDEIHAINLLVQSLSRELSDSNDDIAKLHNIAKGLVPKEQLIELQQPPTAPTPTEIESDEANESLIIAELERERLEIVMDLQRQDYITEKLTDLIDQNEDIVATVKEYLGTKDAIRQEEEEHAARSFNNYVDNVLDPTEEKLDICVQDMKKSMQKVSHLLNKVTESNDNNYDILESLEYRNEVNALIKIINSVMKNGIVLDQININH